MFKVWVGGGCPPSRFCFRASYPDFPVSVGGTECGVTSRLALSRQVAASSPVFRVLVGWTVLPRSLGTRLGGAQASPGQLPASVVDERAAAQ